jgi:uncharacterized membrane protein
MKCNCCDRRTLINWGNSDQILCEHCLELQAHQGDNQDQSTIKIESEELNKFLLGLTWGAYGVLLILPFFIGELGLFFSIILSFIFGVAVFFNAFTYKTNRAIYLFSGLIGMAPTLLFLFYILAMMNANWIH